MHARSLILGLALCLGCGGSEPTDAALSDGASMDSGREDEDAQVTMDAPSDVPGDAPSPLYRVLTGQGDGVIATFELTDSGELNELGRTRVSGGPSFIDVARSGREGAVVLEGSGQIVMLSLAAGTGVVSELGGRRGSEGGGPTHVSIDRSGRWAMLANYGGGTIAVFPFQRGVGLGASSDTAAPGMRAHQILTTPSNDWVLVPCLGADHVATLAFDDAAGTLEDSSELDMAAGAGPRHVAITRDGRTVFLTNELSSTVQVLALDERTGVLTARSTVSSLPSGFGGSNTTAEIALHPSERFLYVSNRGHDSIAVFAIDDGTLSPMGHALLMARTPRSFAIDPSGRFLLAGAQSDDEIVRFSIATDGSLTRLGTTGTSGAPTFVGVFEVAR